MPTLNLIRDIYGGRGFVFADIRADPRFLEEPGQLDLVYNVTEGQRYRVGKINVRIRGEHPHTRHSTVLNRLSLRPGDILDIRKLRDDERRLKSSSLFLADAAKGEGPKIVFSKPEPDDTRVAREPEPQRPPGFRGQSPDGVEDDAGDRVLDLVLEGEWIEQPQQAVQPTAAGRPPASSPAAAVPRIQRRPGRRRTAACLARPESTVPGSGPARSRAAVRTAAGLSAAGADSRCRSCSRRRSSSRGEVRRWRPRPPTRSITRGWSPPPPPVYTVQQPMAPAFPGGVAAPGQQPILQPAVAGGGPFGTTPVAQMDPSSPERSSSPAWCRTSPPIRAQVFPGNEPYVVVDVDAEETQTGRLMIGAGVNSNAGLVGNIVVDEQNFDILRLPRSWDDIRNGTAFRGAGQRFRLEAAPGTQLQRYMATFQEPYLFDTRIGLSLSPPTTPATSTTGRRPARAAASAWATSSQFAPDLSVNTGFRGESVDVFNPRVLAPAINEHARHQLRLWLQRAASSTTPATARSCRRRDTWPTFEFEQVIGTFVYPRGIARGTAVLPAQRAARRLGPPRALDRLGARHVGPRHARLRQLLRRRLQHAPRLRVPRGEPAAEAGLATAASCAIIGGPFEWLNTIEYLFPITADDTLRGVVFTDFGTVESNVSINNMRVAPGFGLRITLPAMGPAPIALDFAVPVAYAPVRQQAAVQLLRRLRPVSLSPGGRHGDVGRSEPILVVGTQYIGDTLLAIPFLRNLRPDAPARRDRRLRRRRCAGRARGDCPYIDELIDLAPAGGPPEPRDRRGARRPRPRGCGRGATRGPTCSSRRSRRRPWRCSRAFRSASVSPARAACCSRGGCAGGAAGTRSRPTSISSGTDGMASTTAATRTG